jgi:hydroxyethylthiazole kinase-like uncharacterized protein yjeF
MPILVNEPALWRQHVHLPGSNAHKYTRGHCLVISGPELRTGASRLAAIAAMHAGTGAVTIAGDAAALRVHAAHLTAIMLQPVEHPVELARWIESRTPSAAVIGPAVGIGAQTLAMLDVLLSAKVPTVIDADALTSLGAEPERLARRADASSPIVLTPHAGEFARLFHGLDADAMFRHLPPHARADKAEQTRAAARLANAIVVFKGPETVIADPSGRAALNANAGPELAVAGTGDVLAGLIGAHLAMAMPAFEAAASAVWLHGAIGHAMGFTLTAERLAAQVTPLFTRLAPRA